VPANDEDCSIGCRLKGDGALETSLTPFDDLYLGWFHLFRHIDLLMVSKGRSVWHCHSSQAVELI
jgi:hypothetical protein